MAIAGPAIERAERFWRMYRPAVEATQLAAESAQVAQRAWEALLQELEATLIFDPVSAWRVTSPEPSI